MQFQADLARSFVDSIVAVLVSKSEKALKQTGCKHLVLAGGVGANKQLRNALNDKAQKNAFEVGHNILWIEVLHLQTNRFPLSMSQIFDSNSM